MKKRTLGKSDLEARRRLSSRPATSAKLTPPLQGFRCRVNVIPKSWKEGPAFDLLRESGHG